MNTNGVSKKLCISIIGIQAIVQLSADEESKILYALLITGIIALFKIVQYLLDKKALTKGGRQGG